MKDELTQRELDEIFYGRKPVVEAEFYDHEVVDIPASKRAGKRVMKVTAYIRKFCEKEGSEHSRVASDADIREFPESWSAYLRTKDNEPREIQDVQPETADCAFISR